MWIDPHKPASIWPVRAVLRHGTRQDADPRLRGLAGGFAKWIAHQKMAAEDDPAAAEGRLAFEHTACVNCHTVNGTSAKGKFGPI